MITGVIQLDFAVAGIDRQPLLIAEKCVARLILTAGGVRMFAEFFWPPALWRFHGRHWFHFRHGFHTFQSEPSLSEKFPAFGYPRKSPRPPKSPHLTQKPFQPPLIALRSGG